MLMNDNLELLLSYDFPDYITAKYGPNLIHYINEIGKILETKNLIENVSSQYTSLVFGSKTDSEIIWFLHNEQNSSIKIEYCFVLRNLTISESTRRVSLKKLKNATYVRKTLIGFLEEENKYYDFSSGKSAERLGKLKQLYSTINGILTGLDSMNLLTKKS